MVYRENTGEKIRKIREARNMSIPFLAEQIGISADMMQKYENGQRKPKMDRIDKIAKVLHVNPASLIDNMPTTDIGAIYSLFQLEDHYKLEIKRDYNGNGLCIHFDKESPLIPYLEEWKNKKIENADNEQLYNEWKWNYTGKTASKRQQINELKKEMMKLEEELATLEQGE